jgi:threonine dehydratase
VANTHEQQEKTAYERANKAVHETLLAYSRDLQEAMERLYQPLKATVNETGAMNHDFSDQ